MMDSQYSISKKIPHDFPLDKPGCCVPLAMILVDYLRRGDRIVEGYVHMLRYGKYSSQEHTWFEISGKTYDPASAQFSEAILCRSARRYLNPTEYRTFRKLAIVVPFWKQRLAEFGVNFSKFRFVRLKGEPNGK